MPKETVMLQHIPQLGDRVYVTLKNTREGFATLREIIPAGVWLSESLWKELNCNVRPGRPRYPKSPTNNDRYIFQRDDSGMLLVLPQRALNWGIEDGSIDVL